MPVEHPPVPTLPAGQPGDGILEAGVAGVADPAGGDGVDEPGGRVGDIMRRRLVHDGDLLQRRDQRRRRPVMVDDHRPAAGSSAT